jgi:hypothetical protein
MSEIIISGGGGLEYLHRSAASRKNKKGIQCPWLQLGHPVPGGYKYGDLALQVGGVSNETVKYGLEFCGPSTQESLLWQGQQAILQVNYRSILSSERVPHIKKPAIVREIFKTDWPTDSRS